jgi:hypothetical protein
MKCEENIAKKYPLHWSRLTGQSTYVGTQNVRIGKTVGQEFWAHRDTINHNRSTTNQKTRNFKVKKFKKRREKTTQSMRQRVILEVVPAGHYRYNDNLVSASHTIQKITID